MDIAHLIMEINGAKKNIYITKIIYVKKHLKKKDHILGGFFWVFLGGFLWVFLGSFFWAGFLMPTLSLRSIKNLWQL